MQLCESVPLGSLPLLLRLLRLVELVRILLLRTLFSQPVDWEKEV